MKKEEKHEIYFSNERRYELQVEHLKNADILEENKEIIFKFTKHLHSKECSKSRINKLMWQLRRLCEFMKEEDINKKITEINKEDLISLISHINLLEIKPVTKADYRKIIKQFFKWYKDDDILLYEGTKEQIRERNSFYKYLKDNVKRTYKKEQIDPSSIITKKDIEQVLDLGCRSFRDKALISCLFESGTRAGEFLGIRMKDINFKDNFVNISVNGKTGRRTIPLVECINHLHRYLEIHPEKNNPEGLVWLSHSNSRLNLPLDHNGFRRIIKACFERAKSSKRCNPHWFRHSRASELAPKMTEQMMCKYFGWYIGSNQVKTYVHLNQKELNNVFLTIHGIQKEDNIIENKPQRCSCCNSINQPNTNYCYKCGQALDVSIHIHGERLKKEQTEERLKGLIKLAQNPEFMKIFEEYKEGLKEK